MCDIIFTDISKINKSVKLKATLEPEDALTRELKWKVSNKKYAKITKAGKLTALKAGKGKTVKVTATATDGTGCKVTIKVKIK
ncbi:MAG: Ig-like domain-containing protein [Lachnospiraceae bacterium]|nr:Ig-like domain-containing protein [Lachnospiraceae bacterium]